MRNTLQTISEHDLDRACGGNNSTEAKGNIGVTAKGIQVGVQGEYRQSRTDYATCLSRMAGQGATPAQMAEFCGKPGGGQ
jgi:hypothetical protein